MPIEDYKALTLRLYAAIGKVFRKGRFHTSDRYISTIPRTFERARCSKTLEAQAL